MKKLLLFTFGLFFCFLSCYQALAQDTYFVSPPPLGNNGNDGITAPWATIKYAVENVAVGDGDTIEIASALYNEIPFTINKSISLKGTGTGAVQMVPAGGNPMAFISVTSPEVQINNLTIDGDQRVASGLVISGTDVTVRNATITGAEVGILAESTATGLTLTNNNLANNTTAAIQNNSTAIVDASFNWWGSQEQSDVTSQQSGAVDYSPWLNSGADTEGGVIGFQGDYSSLSIDGDSPIAAGGVNDLQMVADLLNANETLRLVDSENAYSSLTIDKSLTLDIPDGQPQIDTLEINIPDANNNTLLVTGNLLITDSLSLTAGNIETGEDAQVTLGDNIQTTNESNGLLIGSFAITPRSLDSGKTLNILGVSILGGGASNALSGLVIQRISGDQGIVENNGSQSIKSRWIINANQAPSGRGLTFAWSTVFDNRLEGNDQASVVVWRQPDGSDEWEPVTQSQAISSVNDFRSVTVNANEVTGFSTWTVSDDEEPLPITLTDFSAQLEKPSVRLAWTTASEINAHFFGIERSTDGFIFEEIAQNQAAGTSNSLRNYFYIDEGVTNRLSGTLYYRLRLVDFDDSYEYSDIIAVPLTSDSDLRVHADASTATLRLFTQHLPDDQYWVQVSDVLGNVVIESSFVADEENPTFHFPLNASTQSVYVVRCFGSQALFTQKFRVE